MWVVAGMDYRLLDVWMAEGLVRWFGEAYGRYSVLREARCGEG
jgi:hypothetical protein